MCKVVSFPKKSAFKRIELVYTATINIPFKAIDQADADRMALALDDVVEDMLEGQDGAEFDSQIVEPDGLA